MKFPGFFHKSTYSRLNFVYIDILEWTERNSSASSYRTAALRLESDALQQIAACNPDLAIIDLMMPELDGYELCRKLRQYYENLPVLMLAAKGELPAKIKGLEAGAGDYLTKPFDGGELLMRVRALLRRYRTENPGFLLQRNPGFCDVDVITGTRSS